MDKPAARDDRSDVTTILSEWAGRRFEAFEDTRNLLRLMFSPVSPYEIIRGQQLWLSNSLLRMVDDTTAYQALAERIGAGVLDLGYGYGSAASRSAAATRAAGRPLREADTAAS